jgi:hypothetical protein
MQQVSTSALHQARDARPQKFCSEAAIEFAFEPALFVICYQLDRTLRGDQKALNRRNFLGTARGATLESAAASRAPRVPLDWGDFAPSYPAPRKAFR